MKSCILLVLIVWTLLLMPESGHSDDTRFCQRGVYIMFGNGIWNDVEQAEGSLELLSYRINNLISGTELEELINFSVAYNPSSTAIVDLVETYIQNTETNYVQFWRFLGALDPLPDFLQEKLIEIANVVNEAVLAVNPAVQEHVTLYNKLLSEGNKVVVVAHSQGNLFANLAYLGLESSYMNGFGIVSVGNPDSYVAGGGPYTTLEEDIIIGSIPFSLPANVDNFSPINFGDLTGHKFKESYMFPSSIAERQITNDVIGMANRLEFPDTELGNGIISTTLTWGSNPDMDLHIFEPNGSHVYYLNPTGPSGDLDHDDTDGYGPEHYFVSCETIEEGTYVFGVNYYYGTSAEVATVTVQAGEQMLSKQQFFNQWIGYDGNDNPSTLLTLNVSGSYEDGFEFEIE